jgi:hypothetical protein
LAKTVGLFREEVILATEGETNLPSWTPFLERQGGALNNFSSVDLSVADEVIQNGQGPFNRRVKRYASFLLTEHSVRTPELFVRTQMPRLRVLIPDIDEIVPYIMGEASI